MFEFLYSLLFPKRCVDCRKLGSYICPNCFAKISFATQYFCAVCNKNTIDGATHPRCKSKYEMDGLISAITYKGIVKKLLYQFKYKPYLSDLKIPLSKLLYEGVIQSEIFNSFLFKNKDIVVVPVPLHPSRLKSRGYNQSALLATEFGKLSKLAVVNILKRTKQTKPQFELKREQRLENLKGAFTINEKVFARKKITNVILIDDIATTGATLRECGKVLKKSGAVKVLGIALAHEI